MGELEITTGLDQPVQAGFFDDPQWQYVVEQVQQADSQCVENGDVAPLADLTNSYREGTNLNLKGLALSLYVGRARAQAFGLSEAAYLDLMYERVGLSSNTMRRYLRTWENLFANKRLPSKFRGQMLERSMDTCYKVSQVVDSVKDKKVLSALANTTDHREVVKLVKAIKGQPDKVKLNLRVSRDGTLEVWEGKKCSVLGILRNSDEDLQDDLRRRGYQLLLRGTGAMEE